MKSMRLLSLQVVCMNAAPGLVSDDRAVLVNLGDPLRKNTLCVEITPASKEVSLGSSQS